MSIRRPMVCALFVFAGALPAVGQQAGPPLPHDVPVMLVGDPLFQAARLKPYEATFAMGRIGKAGPLKVGERIDAGVHQTMSLERTTVDGRDVLARRFSVARGDGEELASGVIYLDATTLAPLRSEVTRQGATTEFRYDWEGFVVTQSPAPPDGSTPAEEHADLRMLEAGVHDVWIAALPLRDGFAARIPVMMAGGGGKFWAVPRVTGSEQFDIGDGVLRDAWVVELDWWGMGKDGNDYYPGGGANGSGGSGGKYWVLKSPPAGVPGVVRVRTEVDEANDSIIQMQRFESD